MQIKVSYSRVRSQERRILVAERRGASLQSCMLQPSHRCAAVRNSHSRTLPAKMESFDRYGPSQLAAAQAGGMERQTPRGFVRSNADGPTGLADRPRPGRQPRLTGAQRRAARGNPKAFIKSFGSTPFSRTASATKRRWRLSHRPSASPLRQDGAIISLTPMQRHGFFVKLRVEGGACHGRQSCDGCV
jgi:hypothetical protein